MHDYNGDDDDNDNDNDDDDDHYHDDIHCMHDVFAGQPLWQSLGMS